MISHQRNIEASPSPRAVHDFQGETKTSTHSDLPDLMIPSLGQDSFAATEDCNEIHRKNLFVDIMHTEDATDLSCSSSEPKHKLYISQSIEDESREENELVDMYRRYPSESAYWNQSFGQKNIIEEKQSDLRIHPTLEERIINVRPAFRQKRINFRRVVDESYHSYDQFGGVEESKDDEERYFNDEHAKVEDKEESFLYLYRNQLLSEEGDVSNTLNFGRPIEKESQLETIIQNFTDVFACGQTKPPISVV